MPVTIGSVDNQSADFFTNIVTISSIVLFAKFVTHRHRSNGFSSAIHAWHLACIVLCVLAIVSGLAGTVLRSEPPWPLHVLALVSVAGAMTILLVDSLISDGKLRK